MATSFAPTSCPDRVVGLQQPGTKGLTRALFDESDVELVEIYIRLYEEYQTLVTVSFKSHSLFNVALKKVSSIFHHNHDYDNDRLCPGSIVPFQ